MRSRTFFNRYYDTTAVRRSDNRLDTVGETLHSKSKTSLVVQSHVRTYMRAYSRHRRRGKIQHGGSEQAKVRRHQKTRTSTGYTRNASRKLDSTTAENTSQQIGVERRRTTSLPSSPRRWSTLHDLHKVSGEHALPAVDLPRPPRIRVLALLGDSDHLPLRERQVASLQASARPKNERRSVSYLYTIHHTPST